jgi:hypothetical protein
VVLTPHLLRRDVETFRALLSSSPAHHKQGAKNQFSASLPAQICPP